MIGSKSIAVVVPAYNEEALIGDTLAGIPSFVDRIIVVDDASKDATAEKARGYADPQIEVIVHEKNQGVGAAIVTGYKRALAEGIDVTAVMAGDNQMDPDELEKIAAPVLAGEVDYAKANRLISGRAWELIPRSRYIGNAVLSLLTKIASGYWHVADSQAGYTAISLDTLERLDLDRVYTRYGFPNDLLVHLNVINARVRDIPSRPIYNVGEKSGIKIRKVVPRISWLLLKGFFWRMREKYVIRDFHPLVFFYLLGIVMTRRRRRPRHRRDRAADHGQRDHTRDDRPRRAAPDRGQPVHAVRDVVRHGVEQRPALRRREGGPSSPAATIREFAAPSGHIAVRAEIECGLARGGELIVEVSRQPRAMSCVSFRTASSRVWPTTASDLSMWQLLTLLPAARPVTHWRRDDDAMA